MSGAFQTTQIIIAQYLSYASFGAVANPRRDRAIWGGVAHDAEGNPLMAQREPTGGVKEQGGTVQHGSTGVWMGNGFYSELCKMEACWTGGTHEGQVASSLKVHRHWLPCGVRAPHWLWLWPTGTPCWLCLFVRQKSQTIFPVKNAQKHTHTMVNNCLNGPTLNAILNGKKIISQWT